MSTFIEIHRSLWQSFRRLPLWVQIWVAGILVPVNLLSFYLLEYASARMIAVAAVLALGSNMWFLYRQAGFTRLMAVPHLLVWGPLQVMLLMLLMQLMSSSTSSSTEAIYIGLVLGVNGISLCFDLLDTWRWIKGGREVF